MHPRQLYGVGNDQRIIETVRVGGFGNAKVSPQMYFSFLKNCPNELVLSYHVIALFY